MRLRGLLHRTVAEQMHILVNLPKGTNENILKRLSRYSSAFISKRSTLSNDTAQQEVLRQLTLQMKAESKLCEAN